MTVSTFEELDSTTDRDWETGSALARALDLWCRENKALEAAVYSPSGDGRWRRIQASSSSFTRPPGQVGGDGSLPRPLETGRIAVSGVLAVGDSDDPLADAPDLLLPGGFRFAYRPGEDTPPVESLEGFGHLLSAGVRLHQMHARMQEQVFQENYSVVTLEALYDVGLRIASTLNLEQLSEEILLRAVSLLDARRGALYLRQGQEFVLDGTIGGDALASISIDDDALTAMLDEQAPAPDHLLPGATHVLAVPIAFDSGTEGILAVADKESRTGVGPFLEGDERALALFANQAAIALENARLHREALEKERLERELELAAEIQRGILPTEMPQLGSVELAGWNRPTQQVGGDYYGTVTLGDGRTAVVVADVTGKGMPAALLVSTLHSALHLLLDNVTPGAELLSRLNQHISESSGANKFITMILAIVEPQSSRLGFLNAGHNPGLVVRTDGEVAELLPSGLPLGLMPKSSYRLDSVELLPGDLVCLFSDGITECESPDEEEYGADRLARFLIEHRDLPLGSIIAALDKEVAEFACHRPQGDDQTVVLLRRGPAASSAADASAD